MSVRSFSRSLRYISTARSNSPRWIAFSASLYPAARADDPKDTATTTLAIDNRITRVKANEPVCFPIFLIITHYYLMLINPRGHFQDIISGYLRLRYDSSNGVMKHRFLLLFQNLAGLDRP